MIKIRGKVAFARNGHAALGVTLARRAFTLPVVLQRLVGEHDAKWGPFAAGALLVSLPVVAIFYAVQKQLVGGLTAGGVKG